MKEANTGPTRRVVMFLFALLFAGAMPAWASSQADQEIQFLISTVQSLGGAKFVRNGTSYDPKSAADHLRLKLKNAGSRVATAEDFIRLCATQSSASGQPYQIRFADGSMVATEEFLTSKLAEYRKGHVPGR